MLSTRILTAVLLIAAVLAALFLLPPRYWLVASFLLIAIAATEWAQLEHFPTTGRIAFTLGLAAIALAEVDHHRPLALRPAIGGLRLREGDRYEAGGEHPGAKASDGPQKLSA